MLVHFLCLLVILTKPLCSPQPITILWWWASVAMLSMYCMPEIRTVEDWVQLQSLKRGTQHFKLVETLQISNSLPLQFQTLITSGPQGLHCGVQGSGRVLRASSVLPNAALMCFDKSSGHLLLLETFHFDQQAFEQVCADSRLGGDITWGCWGGISGNRWEISREHVRKDFAWLHYSIMRDE